VRCEAGVVVETLLEALAPHGMTLANFSSIKDQQMGGWTQVAAHGTGATLATVDEMIVSMKLVTPALGTLTLSASDNPDLFKLGRVGLGALGIVSEVTLECMPTHQLHEKMYVVESGERLRSMHKELLQAYRHVRYMWIPSTEHVVVVVSNPVGDDDAPPAAAAPAAADAKEDKKDPRAPLRDMLVSLPGTRHAASEIERMSFADLRDHLLDAAPLDAQHVQNVNDAEAEFWQRSQGERVDWSDKILGFECGGQQWVLELAFPTGTLKDPSYKDLDFVQELKQHIKTAGLPAPSPIEQRWTASSTSPMSPAGSSDPDEVFCWVGIIMYMPPGQGEDGRTKITETFHKYAAIAQSLGDKYGAVPHWAKIEVLPESSGNADLDGKHPLARESVRARMRRRYPVEAYNKARDTVDPKHVLSNDLIETLFDDEA